MHVRLFRPADEQGWLRCRVVAFLATAYFDDVAPSKPTYDGTEAIELVAVDDEEDVVGILDVTVDAALATIETIAVHPDVARQGVATALIAESTRRLPAAVEAIDAWTRDDAPANAWYTATGFRETFRYLHVFADDDELSDGFTTPPHLTAVRGFFHAPIDQEDDLRRRFRRVHVCRRFVAERYSPEASGRSAAIDSQSSLGASDHNRSRS
jgi:ribosomal protein S18 acetylase RimI-like enzyme